MSISLIKNKTCIVIGASHAGVNFAFSLRREGWEGDIILYDADPFLPYHRPPLSKAYLTSEDGIDKNLLKSEESYAKEGITLNLGVYVKSMDRKLKHIILGDGSIQSYDKLIIATGARPIMPSIQGLANSNNVFPLRTATDVSNIRSAVKNSANKEVVVIGGGYIGLETAASLKKLGAKVTVLEREERILARVTAPEMSTFFQNLHLENGVDILTSKNVIALESNNEAKIVRCDDGTSYRADLIIIGVGIFVNKELAAAAGLDIENGIKVDETAKTNDEDIYAIGDCTFHYNPHYDRYIRLESVQNAVDQAKVAATSICGKETQYDTVPWFWSDQYDVKLQMVGLSQGYDQVIVRRENNDNKCLSFWYFKGEILLAVDAVNNAKAYVYGTKLIKRGEIINKENLMDCEEDLKIAHLISPIIG
ncbi:pyridine nucleotide-disulfide oxidoreductase [Arenibacter sp. N53]|uniref:NAD(P)/FAD-dependent oxidoreductase n=1 Tax=Arenibacter TaxID=178469 RepID=UPI000CD43CC0|nr:MULTISPECIES: FAD-dependent oxidoreductase [Arenibacter]MCM4153514.1 pyridine nucleotide-disulfide oxidoreductase [Arenibacter sp. N53]